MSNNPGLDRPYGRLHSPPSIRSPERRRDDRDGLLVAALGAGTLLVGLTVITGAILVHGFIALHAVLAGFGGGL